MTLADEPVVELSDERIDAAGQIRIADQLPRPVAYVLAGGASFGSVQVGQLMALAKTDLVPDFVVGTSVGSLNGAIVAEDPVAAPQKLLDLWMTIQRADVFGKTFAAALSLVKGKPYLVQNDSLRELAERATSARDFADLRIPHTAITTDLDTGEVVPLNSGDLIDALLASAAIPGVFPWIERDGRRLVDGGVVENVPISTAIAQGAETVVVLDCGFTLVARHRTESVGDMFLQTAAIMASLQVRRALTEADGKTILYLPGPWPIGSMPDDFSRAEELASSSHDMSLEWLKNLEIDGPGKYGEAPIDSFGKAPGAQALVADHE